MLLAVMMTVALSCINTINNIINIIVNSSLYSLPYTFGSITLYLLFHLISHNDPVR